MCVVGLATFLLVEFPNTLLLFSFYDKGIQTKNIIVSY